LRNPNCLAHLPKEVDNALESTDIIATYDKVWNLPYLKACLDESLRTTPPFSYNLPRRTPLEGAIILEEYVPGHTSVSIFILCCPPWRKYIPRCREVYSWPLAWL